MKLKDQLRQLRYIRLQRWLVIICLVTIGISIGNWLGQQEIGIKLNYKIYQYLRKRTSTLPPSAKNTVVVLIGDEEYWKGELGRRAPIKRDYLADVIRALDRVNPRAIAIGFDLHSPTSDGSIVEHSDYKKETDIFLNAVRDVSKRTPIVLPKTIAWREGYYISESDIYDGFDFQGGKVTTGYIALPFDIQRIPLELTLKDGTTVESFPQAIINLAYADERPLQHIQQNEWIAYGDYIDPENFSQLFTGDVLNADPNTLESRITNKIVIIGAAWNSRSYRKGPPVDLHSTPIGNISGAFLNANYVEALLESRVYTPVNHIFLTLINILIIIVVLIILILEMRLLLRLTLVMILGILWALYIFNFIQDTTTLFEFVVPLLLIALNTILWQIFDWRLEAHKNIHQREVYEQLPALPSQAKSKVEVINNRQSRSLLNIISYRNILPPEPVIAFYLLISAFISFLVLRLITNEEIIVALGTLILAIVGMRLLSTLHKTRQISRFAKDSFRSGVVDSSEVGQ